MTTPIDQFKGKQLDIINWWRRYPDKQTIIADGAVRSGKTFAMSISYVLWSMIMLDHYAEMLSGHSNKHCNKWDSRLWIGVQKICLKSALMEEPTYTTYSVVKMKAAKI